MEPFRREFDYFLILCETLNMSEAAEQAGIGQAGLSKSLKSLELELGKPLFYRTNRGLKITPMGEIIRSNLLKSFSLWNENFENDLGQLSDIIGRFKIGIHPTIALNIGASFFPYLNEEYPALKLEFEMKRSADVLKEVVDFQLDFGIVANPYMHPDLVVKKINQEFIACWAREKADHKQTLYYNPEMIDIVRTLKKYQDYKHIAIDDYEVIASLMKESKGIAILPSPVAQRYKTLQQIGKKIADINICLIYRHDALKTDAFNEIASTIKKQF